MNHQIVGSALVIGGVAVANALTEKKPITKIIMGDFIFLFTLSILDLFGGPFASIAGSLAMLAVLVTVLTEVNWQNIIKTIGA